MALIKCPECGKKISDTSDVCIHCGYKLKKTKKRNDDEPDVNGFNDFLNANSSSSSAHASARKSAEEFAGDIEKVIAGREKASSGFGAFFFALGAVAFVLFIIWLINGLTSADPRAQIICFSVLGVGAIFFLLSIPFFNFASKNNKLPKVCISYNPYSRKLKLYCLNGEIIDIDIEQFVEVKNTMSSNLCVVYKNDAGVEYTAKLGKCNDNRYNIETNINHYKKKKK